MTAPTLRCLSLGAGVQSSVCLLLAAQGRIPTFDAAIFSDTGWEPVAVYRHLHRLTRIAEGAGIPIVRVTGGHIRTDAISRLAAQHQEIQRLRRALASPTNVVAFPSGPTRT